MHSKTTKTVLITIVITLLVIGASFFGNKWFNNEKVKYYNSGAFNVIDGIYNGIKKDGSIMITYPRVEIDGEDPVTKTMIMVEESKDIINE